jgi:hypothetical protein
MKESSLQTSMSAEDRGARETQTYASSSLDLTVQIFNTCGTPGIFTISSKSAPFLTALIDPVFFPPEHVTIWRWSNRQCRFPMMNFEMLTCPLSGSSKHASKIGAIFLNRSKIFRYEPLVSTILPNSCGNADSLLSTFIVSKSGLIALALPFLKAEILKKFEGMTWTSDGMGNVGSSVGVIGVDVSWTSWESPK